MPARSKIQTLPEDVRHELDRRLIANGFGGHEDLAEWLAGQGFEISKSSVQRYSSVHEMRIEQLRQATQSAESLVEASGDDKGALADASLRLVQQRMYDVMIASEDEDIRSLSTAARALADTARAGTQVRQERRKLREQLAEKAETEAKKRGISADTAAAIRRALTEV